MSPLLVVVVATALSYPIGLALRMPWLLPALNAAPAYLALVRLVRAGRRDAAVGVMLAWAATLVVAGTTSFALWPTNPGPFVFHGPEYRDEMFIWILTGLGAEGEPARFLPQHAIHLAAFVALSLATASAASILMGAVLMDYMAFYVASLARAGLPVGTVVLFGWQPYALSRVAAFSILGVVLAEPLLARLRGGRFALPRESRRWMAIAAALLVADVALKAAVAPLWGRTLRAALLRASAL